MNHHNPPRAQFANPKMERILLGGLILNDALYWQIEHSIRPDSFTVPLHRAMFEQIIDLIMAGQKIKLPLLWSRLPEEGDDEHGHSVSVRSYISICIDEAGEVNATDCAEDIAELASKRRLLRLSQEIGKAIQKGEKRSDEIATEIEAEALDIVGVSAPRRPKRLSSIAPAVIQQARVAREQGKVVGFETGIAAVDEIIGSILPGDLIFLLASQSDGKTLLSRQIAKNISLRAPVLEIQMEMSDEQLIARDLSAASGISASAISEGRVDAFDFERVEAAADVISHFDYYVHDVPEISIRQIKGVAQSMKRSKGLGFILIDQFDKIRTERHIPNKFDRGTELTRDLKTLAKELRIPIMVLAQRTRMAQRSDGEVPKINDAEFPSIEKDADIFLAIWRRFTWLQQFEPDPSNEVKHTEWRMKVDECEDRLEAIGLKVRRGKRFKRREMRIDWKSMTVRDV
jgi:replicative DNA helicase